jgi:hypothetical protein
VSGHGETPPTGGIRFRKALASGGSDNCVEVTLVADRVLVRHSKDTSGPVLAYTRDEWVAFLDGAVNGEFDLEALEHPAP